MNVHEQLVSDLALYGNSYAIINDDGSLTRIDPRRMLVQTNACTKDGGQCEPAYCMADAYAGARDEVAVWKKAALEAEAKLRTYGERIVDLGVLGMQAAVKRGATTPVLPPRRKKHFETREIGRQSYQNGSTDGWNAYDDEFKRLNPELFK